MKSSSSNCWPRLSVESHDAARVRVNTIRAGLGLILVMGSCAGCSTFGVKPWDHDLLAEKSMQVVSYPLESSIDDHIYFSKEASSGGRSFAGGGCGCN